MSSSYKTNYKTSSTDIGNIFAPGTLISSGGTAFVSTNNKLEYGNGSGAFTVPTASSSNPNSWWLVTMVVTFSGTGGTSWNDASDIVCGLFTSGNTSAILYQWLSVAGGATMFYGPFYNTTWVKLPSGQRVQPYAIKNGSNSYTVTFTIYINSQPPALT